LHKTEHCYDFSHFHKSGRNIISPFEPGGGLSSPPLSLPPAIASKETKIMRTVTTHFFALLVAATISAIAIGSAVTV
tara:strand:- start:1361 stop:1591 length:231 start_codon:yes stop_codon:yes gene_type:complete